MTRRLLALAALTAALVFAWVPAAGAQTDLNCDDFEFQEDAQAVLDQDPSDPNGLDSDNDGIACEDLPSGSGGGGTGGGDTDEGGAPVGGVDTGAGGAAPAGGGTNWPLIAAVGVVGLGAVVLYRRNGASA